MKNISINFAALFLFLAQIVLGSKKLVCYYDSGSTDAISQITSDKTPISLCTHLITGYADLDPDTGNIALNKSRNLDHVLEIKKKYDDLKIYLSLGGDRVHDTPSDTQYTNFLEGGLPLYENFTNSSIQILKNFSFDGLDLAFRFPRNKPRAVLSLCKKVWNYIANWLRKNNVVDKQDGALRNQFTDFVNNLHQAYEKEKLSISLTVLPNVNIAVYIDIAKIHQKFKYINLFAFDFFTPERNPQEADYTAPLYFKNNQDRLPHNNIDFQVKYLKDLDVNYKLNLGIPTFARTWKTTTRSSYPVVSDTLGPAAPGRHSNREGLLSYGEVCLKQKSSECIQNFEYKYGSYVICPTNSSLSSGMWMGFDNPEYAVIKTDYVIDQFLGGVAIVDIIYDDFDGKCEGVQYPILKAVKQRLDKEKYM